MINKDKLLETIEQYDIFTKSQRKILTVLIKVAVENKAVISVAKISEVTGLSSASVYQTIELFKKDHILELLVSSNNKINSFILNKARLEEIEQIVQNTKKL